jgi:hypothetical protein
MTFPETSPGSEVFRRSLDRAVARGRALRLAAILGCWCTCAGVIWGAAVVTRWVLGLGGELGGPEPWPLRAGVAVSAALVTAGLFRAAVCAGRWPTRLAVALETERRDPRLGERLSRAVGFLEEPIAKSDAPTAEAALTGGLRRLAIEQAREALPGRPAVPGAAADLKWIAAGIVAVVAVTITTVAGPARRGGARPARESDRTAVHGRPTEGGMRGDGAVATDAARAAVVRRLDAEAAVERRVADVAAAVFAEAPGARRESLSRETQGRLDRLAAIQAEVCAAVRAARTEIESLAATPAARIEACLRELDAFASVGGEAIGADIAANRLGLAGDRAASAAAAIAAAATALAASGPDREVDGWAADDLRMARATMALDELAVSVGHPLADTASDAGRRATTGEPTATATSVSGGPGGQAETAGSATGPGETRTTSPGQPTEPAPDARSTVTIDAPSPSRPVGRGWRPPALGAADSKPSDAVVREDAPAAYRPAVAEYYRLLRPQPARDTGSTDPGGAPLNR